VAQLQERRFDEAREMLSGLSQSHPDDPYARLSAGYFLMDVEKQPATASQLLATYIQSQSLDNDVQFRRALNLAKQLAGGPALPEQPAPATADDESEDSE
jgi:hypothetical protein